MDERGSLWTRPSTKETKVTSADTKSLMGKGCKLVGKRGGFQGGQKPSREKQSFCGKSAEHFLLKTSGGKEIKRGGVWAKTK